MYCHPLPQEHRQRIEQYTEELIDKLEQLDERALKIVELRFFSGLSIEETAEMLDVSAATVKRDWNFAKAWLYREIN